MKLKDQRLQVIIDNLNENPLFGYFLALIYTHKMSHHHEEEQHFHHHPTPGVHSHGEEGAFEAKAETFLNNKSIPKVTAGLMLFYLALLGNYTGDIIPPDLAKLISSSRLMQHFIAFIILLFTINLYSENQPFQKVMLYSSLLYIWFLFTSKQHLAVSITILVLLIVSYGAYNFGEDLDFDKRLTDQQKEERRKVLTMTQNICFYVIMGVASIGGLSYFIEHYKEYGADEGFGTFLWKYLFMGKGSKAAK